LSHSFSELTTANSSCTRLSLSTVARFNCWLRVLSLVRIGPAPVHKAIRQRALS
jgi:hypothetical protein